tara:strand:+ start:854 stop:1162 length:309 start_codon:yes stop_codon:yes gene_type:complete
MEQDWIRIHNYKKKRYVIKFKIATGVIAAILRFFNIGGVTLGKTVIMNKDCYNYKYKKRTLINHELSHVEDYIDEGYMMYVKYFTGHRKAYEEKADKRGNTR